jgi:hypothetical protein
VDATSFEFQLSVPKDERVAAIVRKLAVQAARYAGCADSGAEAFGGQVEEAVRAHLNGAPSAGVIPIVVRRSTTGPLEVLVDTRTVALDL